MYRIIAAVVFLACVFSAAHGEDITIEPAGEYATIDTKLSSETIRALKEATGKARADLINQITAAPEKYAPPVLYMLSAVLFAEGRKEDAMFWFYAGQLRGRIDANICAENSSRQAIAVLNQEFGPAINQYAFKDIPNLKRIVEKVLKWEEATPCKYDRRWINLHGMGVFTGGGKEPLSAPKEQWESIRKKTRDEYRSSFYEAMKQLESKNS